MHLHRQKFQKETMAQESCRGRYSNLLNWHDLGTKNCDICLNLIQDGMDICIKMCIWKVAKYWITA